eukprot:15449001-Alexandrium_andersonii.AAC.1
MWCVDGDRFCNNASAIWILERQLQFDHVLEGAGDRMVTNDVALKVPLHVLRVSAVGPEARKRPGVARMFSFAASC